MSEYFRCANFTLSQAVKVTCAVVPDLYDKFILTDDVTDGLSRRNVGINQAQVNDVNDVVNSPANVDDSGCIDDSVAVLSLPVANDVITSTGQCC